MRKEERQEKAPREAGRGSCEAFGVFGVLAELIQNILLERSEFLLPKVCGKGRETTFPNFQRTHHWSRIHIFLTLLKSFVNALILLIMVKSFIEVFHDLLHTTATICFTVHKL